MANIIDDLTSINDLLKQIKGNISDISTGAAGAAGSVSGIAKGGSKGGGTGNSALGLAAVTAQTNGGTGMNGGVKLGQVSGNQSAGLQAMQSTTGLTLGKLGLGLASIGLNAAAGAASAYMKGMPDVSTTLNRAGQFYNAGLTQGNSISRSAMEANAARTGLTATGMSGQINNYMGSMGLNYGSSTWNSTSASIANAAKYMNMDPMAAAQGIVGLNSGSSSANLMRNYGIYTDNPNTGAQKSQKQIFAELEQRFNPAGNKYTVKDVNDSLYKGNLGASLAASGLDESTQQMFVASLRAKAQGKEFDPSSESSMRSALGNPKNTNPLSAQYTINASNESLQSNYEGAYVKGSQAGAQNIVDFNNFMKTAPEELKQFNAQLATATSNTGIAALTSAAADAAGALAMLTAAAAAQGLGSLFKRGSKAGRGTTVEPTTETSSSIKRGTPRYRQAGTGTGRPGAGMQGVRSAKATAAARAGGVKLGAAAKGAGLVGAAMTAIDLGTDIVNGQGWGTKQFSHDAGAGVGGTIGGILGALVPIPGLDVVTSIGGSMLGNWIGGMIGDAFGGTGGDKSTISNNTPTGKTNTSIKYSKPVNAPISDGFGPRKSPFGNGTHTFHHGLDFSAAEGTPIMASAEGKVVTSGMSGEFGNLVKIKHADGNTTYYAHQSRTAVAMGAQVTQGQLIGYVGSTGASTGAHLHFAVTDSSGNFFDPQRLLGGASYVSTGAAQQLGNASSQQPSGVGVVVPTQADILASVVAAGAGGPATVPAWNGSGTAAAAAITGLPATGGVGSATIGANGRQSSMSVPGAGSYKTGDPYVAQDTHVNVHAGEAILTQKQADEWRYAMRSGGLGGGKGNSVTINLTIAQASDVEAQRFANLVKKHLETDRMVSMMGSR